MAFLLPLTTELVELYPNVAYIIRNMMNIIRSRKRFRGIDVHLQSGTLIFNFVPRSRTVPKSVEFLFIL